MIQSLHSRKQWNNLVTNELNSLNEFKKIEKSSVEQTCESRIEATSVPTTEIKEPKIEPNEYPEYAKDSQEKDKLLAEIKQLKRENVLLEKLVKTNSIIPNVKRQEIDQLNSQIIEMTRKFKTKESRLISSQEVLKKKVSDLEKLNNELSLEIKILREKNINNCKDPRIPALKKVSRKSIDPIYKKITSPPENGSSIKGPKSESPLRARNSTSAIDLDLIQEKIGSSNYQNEIKHASGNITRFYPNHTLTWYPSRTIHSIDSDMT
jgi:hypothetical protein